MAKAKITLNDQGPLTYSGNGYNLARGQSVVTTNDETILYFYNRSGFTVDLLDGSVLPGSVAAADEDEDEAPAPKKPKASKPKKSSAPPPSDDEDGDDEDEEDDEEDEEVTGELDEDELSKQTKASLSQLAEEKGLKVEANMTKAQLVALITSAK